MDTDIFKGYPTHIENTGGLLKISVQKDHKLGLFVESYLHENLKDLKSSRFIPKREDLHPGAIGIGQFDDQQYYRVQILDITPQNNLINVLFMDYGNNAKLSLNDIRLLNYEVHKALLNIPPLAITCYLEGVLVSKPWNDDELRTLKKLVLYEEKQCVIRHLHPRVKVINIYFLQANKKLTELILENDLGSPISDIELLDAVKRMKSNRLSTDERIMAHQYPHRLSTLSETYQERMLPTMELAAFNFSSAHLLPVGSSHNAYISHMTDGPYSFSIQLKSTAEDALPRLTRLLSQHDPIVNTKPLLPGTMVMTRLQNENFRRSIVMDVKSNMCQVYHTDYGSTDEVPFSEIYELPSQAHHAPSMALRFCLADIKSTQVTDASKAQFQELLEGKQVLIRVVKQEREGPLLQYCEMFYEGRNVKDILVAFNAPLEYTIQQPPRGKDLKVTVSHIESPSMFYIQYNTKLDLLNNIQDAVNSYCKRQICLKDLSGLNIGSPVAALFEDNVWYRAMILSLSTDSAQVSYVDYGNRCDVFVSQLCQISRDLVTKWRTQAVECCLKGFENDNINEADEMVIARMEETLNHTYNMTPLQILSTNRLLVELVDELGNRMSDIIRQVKAPKQKSNDVQVPPPQSQKPLSPEPTTDFDSSSHNLSNNKNQNEHWKNYGKSSRDKPRWDGNQKGGKSKQKADNMFIRPSIRPILEQQNKSTEQIDERPPKKSYIEHDDRYDTSTNYNRESSFEKPRFPKNQDNRRNKDSFDNKKSTDSWGESANQDLNASFGSNNSQTGDNSRGFGRSTPSNDGWNADRSKPKFGDRSKFGNRNEGRGPRDDKSEDNWSEGSSGRPKRDGGRNRNDGESEGFGGGRFGGGGRKDNGETGGRFGGGRRDGEVGGRFGGGKKDDGEGGGRFGGGRRNDREGGGRFGGGRRDDGEGGGRFGGGRRDDGESGGRFGGGRRDDGESGGRFGGGRRDDGESGGRFGGGRRDDGESGGRFGGGRRDDGESGGRFGSGRRDNGEGGGRFGGRRGDQGESGGGGRFGGGGRRDGSSGFGGSDRRRDENGDRKGGGRFSKDDFRNKRSDFDFNTTPSGSDFGGANEEWGSTETAVLTTPEIPQVVSGSYSYPTISPNSSLQVILTCLIHPHQIYVQKVGCEPDLDFLRSSIDNLGTDIKQFNENSLAPGVPLLARFSEDQALYRGIVKNVLQLNKANILFIDYGNSEDVPLNELYYIPAEILSRPPLAYNCRLFDIEPLNGQWPEDATVFDAYMNEEAHTLKVDNIKLVDGEMIINGTLINSAGESLSQKLIDSGLAVSTSGNSVAVDETSCSQALPEQTVESLSSVTTIQVSDKWIDRLDLLKNQKMYGEILESFGDRTFIISIIDAKVITLATLSDHQADSCIVPGQAIIAEIIDILQDRLKISLFDLDGVEKEPFIENTREARNISPICKFPVIRRTDKIYIPHAENNTLYIQRVADSDRLAEFIDEMYNFYNDTPLEERVWVANTVCAAMSIADGNWYRAEIISSDEKYKVRYLDYGNTEVLPSENLRTLNPQFYFSEMVLAVSLPVNFNSSESPFLESTIGQEFSCDILQGPNDQWFVDLFDISGNRFIDTLLQNNLAEALIDDPFLEINSEIGSSLTRGNKVPIVVSHADSPTMFWVQQQCHIDIVDTLQEKLQTVVVGAENATDSDIVFAAKFTADDVWYRATKVSEGMLRFIDYGNTDSLMESKKLPEELYKPHSGYAIPMHLCAQPCDGDWSADAIKEFELFIEQPNIVAEIINVDYKIVVDLLYGDKSLSKILIDAGYAKQCDYIPNNVKKYLSIDIHDSFNKRIFANSNSEQALPIAADKSEQSQLESIDKSEVAEMQPTKTPQADPTVNIEVLETEELADDPKTLEKVYISHVNSLSDFYVQEDSVTLAVDEVSTSLLDLESEESVTDVKVGGLYAAYYEFDDSWYRAKIISNYPEVHALFYDFGYSAIVNEIRNLPNDLLTKSPLAIHCSLGVEGTASEAQKLKVMSNEGLEEFTMRIKSKGNPTIVELFDTNGTNVLSILDISPKAETEKSKPIRQKVVITHSYGPDSFYAQTCELLAKSENVAIRMINTENFDKLDEIAIGDLIAALYPEDCCWYRGQVLSSAPDIVVRFIDYGNTSVITEHRKLPPELKSIEPLTIKCSLQLPEGYDAWPDESIEAFNSICNNNPGNLEIEFISVNPLNIVELFLNNEPITENLLANIELYGNNSIKCLPNDEAAKGYITHINSVSDFYIQRKDCADLLTQVQAGLSLLEENLNEKPDCGVGSFIAARFIDGEWYRGQIVQTDPEIRVRFIDYGNECNVSEISALTDELMQIPPVAVKCSLELEGVQLKEDANCLFEKLCGDVETQFDFTVKSVQGNLSIVEIILDGKNVLNDLIIQTEDCKETSLKENETATLEDPVKEETKPVEQLEKCFKGHVIHINSITDFYIHKQNSREYIDTIEATLAEAESFEMPSSVEVDDLICAKFEADQIWYRAKVIKTEPTVYVQFIDYGNQSETFETRTLPSEIVHIPPLALRCTLKVNEANEEAFFLLCGDPQTLFDFKIVSCSDGINTIEISLNGEDISEKLSSFQLENCENEECSVTENITDSAPEVHETCKQSIEGFDEKETPNVVVNSSEGTHELSSTSSEAVTNIDKNEYDEKISEHSNIVENAILEVDIQGDQLNDCEDDKIKSSDPITAEDSKDEKISGKVDDKPITISPKEKSTSVKSTAKSPKKVATPTNVKTVAEIKANAKSKIVTRSSPSPQKKTEKLQQPLSVRTSFDDTPVPGSISNPSSPISSPATLRKQIHEEKIVPGQISSGTNLESPEGDTVEN